MGVCIIMFFGYADRENQPETIYLGVRMVYGPQNVQVHHFTIFLLETSKFNLLEVVFKLLIT